MSSTPPLRPASSPTTARDGRTHQRRKPTSFSTLSEKSTEVALLVSQRRRDDDRGFTRLRSQQPLGLTISTHGQVAPTRHPLQANRDDGEFGDLHRRQLAVPSA